MNNPGTLTAEKTVPAKLMGAGEKLLREEDCQATGGRLQLSGATNFVMQGFNSTNMVVLNLQLQLFT